MLDIKIIRAKTPRDVWKAHLASAERPWHLISDAERSAKKDEAKERMRAIIKAKEEKGLEEQEDDDVFFLVAEMVAILHHNNKKR